MAHAMPCASFVCWFVTTTYSATRALAALSLSTLGVTTELTHSMRSMPCASCVYWFVTTTYPATIALAVLLLS